MPEKKSFVPVDELMPKVSLPQVAAFYGVELPELKQIGSEIRSRCFLNCGRKSGERALAIQAEHPAKQWKCHQAGCGKAGNLISLVDLIKPGEPSGGKPRGDRFKAIAADLAAMVAGVVRGVDIPTQENKAAKPPEPEVNVALVDSANEKARALVDLDRKFSRDPAMAPPAVSAYLRRRPFLTAEAMTRWRVGYLPRDAGEDRSGGTMRGRIVYPYLSEEGKLLTWFGRDTEFEEKHAAWMGAGNQEQVPERYRFVKGFHRGLELWGQHRLNEMDIAERVRGLGLAVVSSPNDVIRLDELGVPAVALCSEQVSRVQADKVARLAGKVAGGVVTVFLPCTSAGLAGMRQCLGYIAQTSAVRLAWTDKMYNGRFTGRTPASLKLDEWEEISAFLRTGEQRGWKLN